MNTLSLLARIAAGRTDLTIDLLDETEQPLLLVVDGGSLLQWCAYYGDVTAVRTLLGHGASLDDLGPDKGLNAAAFHGHWQLCQFLLESGASATRVDPGTGETALHSSLTNEDRTRYDLVVSLLLAANADVNAATLPRAPTGSFMRDCRTRGETPLHRLPHLEPQRPCKCSSTRGLIGRAKTRTVKPPSLGRVGTIARSKCCVCFATALTISTPHTRPSKRACWVHRLTRLRPKKPSLKRTSRKRAAA